MTVSETRLRIADMMAEHYRDAEDWQRGQVAGVAGVLQEIIDIVGFEAGPPYSGNLFKSIYDVDRLLDYVRAITKRANA